MTPPTTLRKSSKLFVPIRGPRYVIVVPVLLVLLAAIVLVMLQRRGASRANSSNQALAVWEASADPVGFNRPSPYSESNGSALSVGETDYYVSPDGRDSNDGSIRTPFASIERAANVVVPGATVHVLPGTYDGPILTKISGTESARIRYISEVKWAARLRTTVPGVHWNNRGDYVEIIGFDMSGTSSYGIYNRASHVRVLFNHIHDYSQVLCKEGGAGIEHGIDNGRYSSVDNDTIGNVVHNVRPSADCRSAHGVGIYYAVAGGHIYNNVSYNNGKEGIQLWHAATGTIVANNTVFRNGWSGILVGNEGMCCGSSTGVNDHTVVVNNISVHNGKDGLEEFGRTGVHNVYANNLVFGNSRADIHLQNGLKAKETIVADPQFISYQPNTGGGDYRLNPASVARGKGTKLGAPNYDINGNPRFKNSNCNIGAYE